jgi:3alpha(or 20beta)-hydroxysteroid dehydrogenase
MSERLAGKVALISGAARGQGEAEARLFVAEGANVVVSDVLDDEGAQLAAELGDAARYVHLDVTSEGEWTAAVDQTVTAFGRLDVLINNAGIMQFKGMLQTTFPEYRRIIEINQFGCFLGMRAVAGAMRDSGGGSIVNVSSIQGLEGGVGMIGYSASKFAIRGMTKVAAGELGRFGIRVNSIHPGAIDTEMGRAGVGDQGDEILKGLPIGRMGRVEEVASMVCFLASDESSYSTGAEFVCDGGWTALTFLP